MVSSSNITLPAAGTYPPGRRHTNSEASRLAVQRRSGVSDKEPATQRQCCCCCCSLPCSKRMLRDSYTKNLTTITLTLPRTQLQQSGE
jgi:hypothetical protein